MQVGFLAQCGEITSFSHYPEHQPSLVLDYLMSGIYRNARDKNPVYTEPSLTCHEHHRVSPQNLIRGVTLCGRLGGLLIPLNYAGKQTTAA